MKRILIINIFGIGDVLFSTPLVGSLKADRPDVRIGYLCNRRAYPILKSNPKIDKIFIYEKDEHRRLFRESKRAWLRHWRELLESIRAEGYDAVLDMSLSRKFGWLTRMIGIRRRVGLDYKERGVFLTDRIPFRGFDDKHVVEYYLDLLQPLGIEPKQKRMEIFPEAEDERWADELLQKKNIGGKDFIFGVVPGGGASWGESARYRQWPPERHGKVIDSFIDKFSPHVILMGDPAERDLARTVRSAMRNPVIDLVGETTLGQYLALLKRCDIVLVNDGGPLHMTVAAGTRTISLMGPVDERVYGPYPPEGHTVITASIACRPCYRRFRLAQCEHNLCLRGLTVDDVLEKAGGVMEEIKRAKKG